MFSCGLMVSPFRCCWRPSPSPVLRKTRVSPEDSLQWGRRCPVSACVGSWAGLEGKPVFASPVGQRIMATLELPAHGWGKRMGRRVGSLEWSPTPSSVYKVEDQRGPAAEHGELCSVSCAAWVGAESGGERIHVTCMAESLGCPPETMTTLFISYTPILKEKFTLKKRKSSSCLCCPGGPCSLPPLVHEFAPADPRPPVHAPSPGPWQTQACSLHLRVCFCFADEFVCIRF